jgi:hypothetical protein
MNRAPLGIMSWGHPDLVCHTPSSNLDEGPTGDAPTASRAPVHAEETTCGQEGREETLTPSRMTETACPECGARVVDGLDCQGQLDVVLSWEWTDPLLSAEHFSTVAIFNLQHPSRFRQDAIDGLAAAVVAHIDGGLPVSAIRRQVSRVAAGATRVLKPEAERFIVPRHWALTVGHVYDRNNRLGAADRVREWARSARKELSGQRP